MDYVSRSLLVTSEEVERILIDLEHEGRVRYYTAEGIWRWLK
jgi:hypothetical protein